MLHLSKVRVFAGAVLIAAVWLCGVSYGWTTPGSENGNQLRRELSARMPHGRNRRGKLQFSAQRHV